MSYFIPNCFKQGCGTNGCRNIKTKNGDLDKSEGGEKQSEYQGTEFRIHRKV